MADARLCALRAAAAALPLLLGGCGAWNDALFSVNLWQDPEQADDQVDQVNGTYKGQVTALDPSADTCQQDANGTLSIGDRTLYFPYSPTVIFIAPVGADGTVHATEGDATLDGALKDGELTFTVKTPACTTGYDFRYVV